MQYEVINQPVEINGERYDVGAIVDESKFKPASGNKFERIDSVTLMPEMIDEPSELESLLATGHVVAHP